MSTEKSNISEINKADKDGIIEQCLLANYLMDDPTIQRAFN